MPFQKEQLTGHYSWNNTTLNSLTGEPSRRFFDRFNGDQVLFIINSYGSVSGQYTPDEAQRMEELINRYLPLDVKSEMSVFNWLKAATLKAAV